MLVKYLGFVWAGLLVQDLEASISFYRDVLGLPLLGKGDDWAHFDAANGTRLELMSGGQDSSHQAAWSLNRKIQGHQVCACWLGLSKMT